MDAGVINQVHVVHAGGTGGHAGKTGKEAIDVPNDFGSRRPAALKHVLDQVDAPARGIELIPKQHVGRTGCRTEAAVNAGAQDSVRFRGIGIGELGEGKRGLHYTPAHIRPGLRTPLGSKLSLTRFVKANSAASWVGKTLTAARTEVGERTSVAWPPSGATRRRTSDAPASAEGSSRSQTNPPAQSNIICPPASSAMLTASSAPQLGAIEMRHSGGSTSFPFAANGITSRTACQSCRDATAPMVLTSPNDRSRTSSIDLRWGSEAANPSRRNAVTAAPAPASSAPGIRAATFAGRWAAPETSPGEAMAAAIAATALPGSSPRSRTVSSVSGRGSVLSVTSVRTASVPQEPTISLDRS